jgi:aspartate-semialdehyde dehydrogenase
LAQIFVTKLTTLLQKFFATSFPPAPAVHCNNTFDQPIKDNPTSSHHSIKVPTVDCLSAILYIHFQKPVNIQTVNLANHPTHQLVRPSQIVHSIAFFIASSAHSSCHPASFNTSDHDVHLS